MRRAELDRLDGRHREERLADPAVELSIPRDVAPQAGRHAARADEDRAAERLAVRLRRVDDGDHPRLERACRWRAAASRRGPSRARRTRAARRVRRRRRVESTPLADLDPALARGAACRRPRRPRAPPTRAPRRARGRRAGPGRRTSSPPARSAWPGRGRVSLRAGRRLRVDRERTHDATPSSRSRVQDPDRDRGAERPPAADAALEGGLVLSRSSSGRPARSRAGGRASSRATKAGSIVRPAGIPSRIAVRRGPWDSPAVVRRRGTPRVYRPGARRLSPRHAASDRAPRDGARRGGRPWTGGPSPSAAARRSGSARFPSGSGRAARRSRP